MFIPAHSVSKTDFPLGSASTRLAQAAPRSTKHACCGDAASELLASFWVFFHCHRVTSGLIKAGPALLELGLTGAVRLLESHWHRSAQGPEQPVGAMGHGESHPRPHSLQQTETAVLNVLGKSRGKDIRKASSVERTR